VVVRSVFAHMLLLIGGMYVSSVVTW